MRQVKRRSELGVHRLVQHDAVGPRDQDTLREAQPVARQRGQRRRATQQDAARLYRVERALRATQRVGPIGPTQERGDRCRHEPRVGVEALHGHGHPGGGAQRRHGYEGQHDDGEVRCGELPAQAPARAPVQRGAGYDERPRAEERHGDSDGYRDPDAPGRVRHQRHHGPQHGPRGHRQHAQQEAAQNGAGTPFDHAGREPPAEAPQPPRRPQRQPNPAQQRED